MAKRKTQPKRTGSIAIGGGVSVNPEKSAVWMVWLFRVAIGIGAAAGGGGVAFLATKEAIQQNAPTPQTMDAINANMEATRQTADRVDTKLGKLNDTIIKLDATLTNVIDNQSRDRIEYERRYNELKEENDQRIAAIEKLLAETTKQRDYDKLEARVKALEDKK